MAPAGVARPPPAARIGIILDRPWRPAAIDCVPSTRAEATVRPLALLTVLLSTAAACHYRPAPVGLQGSPGEIAALAGEWTGEYTGTQTGRNGGILLQVVAGRDTAYGDVIMSTGAGQQLLAAHAPSEHEAHARAAEVLKITFVRVAGGGVTGALEPYRAPDCQCVVATTFSGEARGDMIEGTFVTRGPGELQQSGRWRVQRRKP